MSNTLQDRKYLFERHHLSHQQIDRWLGENRSKEFIHEKMQRLGAVKLFIDFTDILRINHFPFISLKGPLLSYRIYGDPAVRFSYDIDVLIELKNLESILKLMLENGYQFGEDSVWPDSKIRQELTVSSSHHLSLYNEELRFSVELHWLLMNNLPISSQKFNKLLAENLTTMDFAGREFTVLNKEFEFLYLMIHGAKHKWERLKWLFDINDFPIEDLDLKKFDDLSKQFKADRIINQSDFLLQYYFNKHLPLATGKRVPVFFSNYALKSIKNEMQTRYSLKDIIQTFRYNTLIFPDMSYKLKTIKGLFISQGDVLNHRFSSKIGYILYRPFSFIKRKKMYV